MYKESRRFSYRSVVLLLSGDLLHVDGFRTTTKGTPQDMDGLFSDHFL